MDKNNFAKNFIPTDPALVNKERLLGNKTEQKKSQLELLEKLKPTKIVKPDIIIHKSGKTDSRLHYDTLKLPKEERRKARSKTFIGIAEALATQFSEKI